MLILLKYFAFIPVTALFLFYFYSKYLSSKRSLFSFDTDFDAKTGRKFLWLIIGIYLLIFGSMSCLRYLSIQSTILDLGVYENRIWQVSHNYRFEYLINGHFLPILFIHAIIYKIISSSLTLLLLQTITISLGAVPLYYLSLRCLRNNKLSLLLICIFFMFPAVEYNNLFDFHPDHLFIVLIILCFYFLEAKKKKWFFGVAVLSMLVKEPYLFAVAALGVYVCIRYKWYKIGISVSVLSIIIFFVHAKIILPYYYEGVNPLINSNQSPYAYLGNSFCGVFKTFFTDPKVVLNELLSFRKLQFVYVLMAPLLFVPFLGFWTLILAIPCLTIQLLSTQPLHYAINNQYTASIIPFIFVSLVYGLKRIMLWGSNRDISSWLQNSYRKFNRARVVEVVIISVLSLSLYFNVVIGVSPVSYLFWNYKKEVNPYSFNNYMISKRDILFNNVENIIPDKASVCVQNSVYISNFAKRNDFWVFPYNYEESDYIVLDEKRLKYIYDHVDIEEYDILFQKIIDTHNIVFQEDGIYLFKKNNL